MAGPENKPSSCDNTASFSNHALERIRGLCINCGNRPPLDRECDCMRGVTRRTNRGEASASSNGSTQPHTATASSSGTAGRPRVANYQLFPPVTRQSQPSRPTSERSPPSRPAIMTTEELLARRVTMRADEATPQDPVWYHVREYADRSWFSSRPIREWTWANNMRLPRPTNSGSRAIGTSVLRRSECAVNESSVEAFDSRGRRMMSTDLNLPTMKELRARDDQKQLGKRRKSVKERIAKAARAAKLTKIERVWWLTGNQESNETMNPEEKTWSTAASDGSGSRGRRSVTWSDEVQNLETGSSRSVSSGVKSVRLRSPPPKTRGLLGQLKRWIERL